MYILLMIVFMTFHEVCALSKVPNFTYANDVSNEKKLIISIDVLNFNVWYKGLRGLLYKYSGNHIVSGSRIISLWSSPTEFVLLLLDKDGNLCTTIIADDYIVCVDEKCYDSVFLLLPASMLEERNMYNFLFSIWPYYALRTHMFPLSEGLIFSQVSAKDLIGKAEAPTVFENGNIIQLDNEWSESYTFSLNPSPSILKAVRYRYTTYYGASTNYSSTKNFYSTYCFHKNLIDDFVSYSYITELVYLEGIKDITALHAYNEQVLSGLHTDIDIIDVLFQNTGVINSTVPFVSLLEGRNRLGYIFTRRTIVTLFVILLVILVLALYIRNCYYRRTYK